MSKRYLVTFIYSLEVEAPDAKEAEEYALEIVDEAEMTDVEVELIEEK